MENDPKALEAAFAQIRAAIDSAEQELMLAKRRPKEETPEEEAAEEAAEAQAEGEVP